MADRPYQKRVDEFLADYTDKFIPTLITGKGTKEAPFTNMAGPENAPLSKEQLDLEKTKIIANSVSPDIFNRILDTMRGEKAIPSHQVGLGTPASEFSNSPEGQRIMRERAIPIPHVSTGFTPPTGGGILEEIKASIPNLLASIHGTGVIDMAPNKEGVYEKAVPTLESIWGIKREGNTFMLPGGEGSMTVGPEKFFLGSNEVPTRTPGAVSGDQLARDRILREAATGGSAVPLSMVGESAIPRSYYDVHPEERALDYMQSTYIKPLQDQYNKALETTRMMSQGFGLGLSRDEALHRLSAAKEGLKAAADSMAIATGVYPKEALSFLGKQAEQLGPEGMSKLAMANYYNRKAMGEEAAIPFENFARYAQGMHALSESQRPHAFPPNSAVYQGAKLLGYVPEKPEAIHPIIRDVINKSQMIDPTTGQQTGFDIRGARQKIGFMVPWLKAQGIEVPKEAYKMTKPEFLAEQKSFIAKLPKKERARYTAGYTEGLWKEYWGE